MKFHLRQLNAASTFALKSWPSILLSTVSHESAVLLFILGLFVYVILLMDIHNFTDRYPLVTDFWMSIVSFRDTHP